MLCDRRRDGVGNSAAREFHVGQKYRLRFINVHVSRPSMRMRLHKGDAPLTWRSLAKDGMNVPPDREVDGPSEVQMGNGETYDFEFVPPSAGGMRLEVVTGGGVFLAAMPIHVR